MGKQTMSEPTGGDFLIEFQDHAPEGVVGKIEDALYSVVGLEGLVPIDKEDVVTVRPSIGIAIVGATYPHGYRAGIPLNAVQEFNENLEDRLDVSFTLRVL